MEEAGQGEGDAVQAELSPILVDHLSRCFS